MNFRATKAEFELMNAIADRAVRAASAAGVSYGKQDALMDINACHSNGCPLKLDELLNADGFNFNHDVFGIRRHLNRETGKLEGFFLPRFARKDVS